ncbi:NfeD family protein [Psychrobacter piscatorii]|uniref:NfeD family protein n=1 Tax=Psychrobacter piscatorii TaxID=554343 RepID=UPI00191A8C63|nr:NfeD family protein [Psychrobacter piscatorii]
MIETIWMIEPWHWLVLGFSLMIAEIFIPTFASLWFGAAAVIVAALAWLLPIPLLFQVLIWLTLSVLFMFAWVKYIKPLSMNRKKAGQSSDLIIGEIGMIVVKPQKGISGMVRFNVPIWGADEWPCRTAGVNVETGDRVVVIKMVGDEMVVAPTQRLQAPKTIHPNITPTINSQVPASSRMPAKQSKASRLSLHKPDLKETGTSK